MTEIERLRAALEEIAAPMTHMATRANGLPETWSSSPEAVRLQKMARRALLIDKTVENC